MSKVRMARTPATTQPPQTVPLDAGVVEILGPDGKKITGEELARLMSYGRALGGYHVVGETGSMNMRLRGLAEIMRSIDPQRAAEYWSEHALFFIETALDELAARMEKRCSTDGLRVALAEGCRVVVAKPKTKKAVA